MTEQKYLEMQQVMKSARNLIDEGYDKLARQLLDDAIDKDAEATQ